MRQSAYLLIPLLALSACGPTLPKLPEIDFARFQPAVREAIEKAHGDAELTPGDAIRTAELAKALHAHSQLDAAAIYYEHARKLDPANFSYHYLLGAALLERGEYARALEALNAALARKADFAPAKYALAEALIASGSLVQAREILQTLGDQPQAHYGLARTLKGPAALAEYEKAVAQEPRYGAAWKGIADLAQEAGDQARADEANRAYARHRLTKPRLDDPEMAAVEKRNVSGVGLMLRARDAEAASNLLEAAQLYEQAVAGDATLVSAWANLIAVQVRLKDFQGAEKTWENAKRQNAESSELLYNYGVLLASTKRRTEARAQFARAVELDPAQANGWYNAGVLDEEDGQLESAVAQFRKAVFADPAHRPARYHLGNVLLRQRKPDEALTHLQMAARGADDDLSPLIYLALSGCYASMRQPERAVEATRRARQIAVTRNLTGLITAIDADLAKGAAQRL